MQPAALDATTERTLRELRETALGCMPAASATSAQELAARRVSAIVLTRDRPEMLRRALDSLLESPSIDEILVIDNDSAAAQAELVASECEAHPRARLHRSERNLGCAGGRILGAKLLEGPLILLLDDDAELLPGAVEHLLAELDGNPGADAVSATVIAPDGRVSHSGGSLEVADGIAQFGLVGAGLGPEELPPSGPAGWVPGTAALVRSSLLRDFPLDEEMAAYHEDNEWCYRISRERPRCFRRSREALVLHHLSPQRAAGAELPSTEQIFALLAAHARFYERHGVLMGPWALGLLPGLQAGDGSTDLADLRLLMELARAKGPEWMLEAWREDALTGLVTAHSRTYQLEHDLRSSVEYLTNQIQEAHRENERLAEVIEEKEATTAYLHGRHEVLMAIEAGGWWQLRGRLLALLGTAERVWRRLGALRPGR